MWLAYSDHVAMSLKTLGRADLLSMDFSNGSSVVSLRNNNTSTTMMGVYKEETFLRREKLTGYPHFHTSLSFHRKHSRAVTMKFTSLILSGLAAKSAYAGVFQRAACNANNCLREVSGTDPGVKPARTQRISDCSSFMAVTVTPAPTYIPFYL